MGNFSKPPLQLLADNLSRGYVGIHVEQGVPVLDRDLNLLNDLISATVQAVLARYIGNGLPANNDGFAVQGTGAANDFSILAGSPAPGACLVNGLEAQIPADITYSSQAGLPALTTPTNAQPDPRQDLVYLDVWLDEVTGAQDPDLLNGDDIGLQTSVRQKTVWAVRVAEGAPLPAAPLGHAYTPLARLDRPRGGDAIDATVVTDLRQTGLTMTTIEQRLRTMEALFQPVFAPSPNQIAPQFGNPGQTVTLSGKNFNLGTLSVLFGTTPADLVGTPSDTQIQANVPTMAAGPVKITVQTGIGSVVSDDSFVVLPSAPPGPAPSFGTPEFTPSFGTINQQITINGQNFDQPGLAVSFGNLVAPIDSSTATVIVARVPTGTTGSVKITVSTDNGSVTSSGNFIVL